MLLSSFAIIMTKQLTLQAYVLLVVYHQFTIYARGPIYRPNSSSEQLLRQCRMIAWFLLVSRRMLEIAETA